MPEIIVNNGAMTDTYSVERIHRRIGGNVIVPVAGGETDQPELVSLCSPYEIVRVIWSTTKEGGPPTVPSPADLIDMGGPGNCVFLDGWRSNAAPMIRMDLVNHMWGMSGEYIYAILTPQGLSSNFPSGVLPFDNPSFNAYNATYQAADFSTKILGNTGLREADGEELRQRL